MIPRQKGTGKIDYRFHRWENRLQISGLCSLWRQRCVYNCAPQPFLSEDTETPRKMEQSVPVGSQVESQHAMEEERDAMHRKRRRRNMEYDSNNVAANCYVADETFLKSFLDSGPDGKDGLLFGFASDMEGVASIPKQTFVQVRAALWGLLFNVFAVRISDSFCADDRGTSGSSLGR